MKEENKNMLFKILEPVVEFLKERGVKAKTSVYRCNYAAITYNEMSNEIKRELYDFVQDKECEIFNFENDKFGNYIIFSFTINGKWSHAYE